MIVCSNSFYDRIPDIKKELEKDFLVVLPNCYDDVVRNEDCYQMSDEEYMSFFRQMFHESRDKISNVDCCLVLNFDKTKKGATYHNYIGASTFLEMYEAFMLEKEIYLYNDLPDKSNMLYDEIK